MAVQVLNVNTSGWTRWFER